MLTTLLVIVEQSFIHVPLLFGAYISFSLLKVPDLSIESAYVIGAVFASQLLANAPALSTGFLLALTVLASCLGGALVGLVSSTLTQYGRFPHLLSSIVTFGLFHGISQLISPVYVSLNTFGNPLMLGACFPQYPELPVLMGIGCITVCVLYALFRTQLGYSFGVYGNNPQFFTNYGISTAAVFMTGITIANALAGMSGYLFAQSNSFMELNMGLGKALFCITALILGKTMVQLKKPCSVLIPLVGTAAYFTIQQLLLKVGFNLKYFTAVQALLVLCILLYTYRAQPRQAAHDNLGV